nr:GAF domain-containing protein [uncultured Roseateles sp.]
MSPMNFYAGQSKLLEMMARDVPMMETLEHLALLIEAQSEGLYCSVLLLDEDGVHVRPGVGPRLPAGYLQALNGTPIGPDFGSCGSAMSRNEMVIASDILSDPRWTGYHGLISGEGFRACWLMPIVSTTKRVLGSFAMYYKESRTPDKDELELMAGATQLAAIAIERQRKDDELQRYQLRLEALVEQRTVELELTLMEQRAIFDTATVAILVVDGERRIARCNRRVEDMLGYEPGELIGLSTRVYFESDAAWAAYGQATREALMAGEGFNGDIVAVRKGGASGSGAAVMARRLTRRT